MLLPALPVSALLPSDSVPSWSVPVGRLAPRPAHCSSPAPTWWADELRYDMPWMWWVCSTWYPKSGKKMEEIGGISGRCVFPTSVLNEWDEVESIWDLTQCACQMSGCQRNIKKKSQSWNYRDAAWALPPLQYSGRSCLTMSWALWATVFAYGRKRWHPTCGSNALFKPTIYVQVWIPFDGLCGSNSWLQMDQIGASDWCCEIPTYSPRIPGTAKGLTSPCSTSHWLEQGRLLTHPLGPT